MNCMKYDILSFMNKAPLILRIHVSLYHKKLLHVFKFVVMNTIIYAYVSYLKDNEFSTIKREN